MYIFEKYKYNISIYWLIMWSQFQNVEEVKASIETPYMIYRATILITIYIYIIARTIAHVV